MECCPTFIVIGLIMDVLHVLPRNALHCWNKVVSVQKISMHIYVKLQYIVSSCNAFFFLFRWALQKIPPVNAPYCPGYVVWAQTQHMLCPFKPRMRQSIKSHVRIHNKKSRIKQMTRKATTTTRDRREIDDLHERNVGLPSPLGLGFVGRPICKLSHIQTDMK